MHFLIGVMALRSYLVVLTVSDDGQGWVVSPPGP